MARDWEAFFWNQAEALLGEAEKIRWSLLDAGAAARSQTLHGQASRGPPINVVETPDGWWVLAGLPGVTPGEVEVRLEEGWLVLVGRRRLGEEIAGGRVHVLEMPCGVFERRMRLPPGRRVEVAHTRFENGLLAVLLRFPA